MISRTIKTAIAAAATLAMMASAALAAPAQSTSSLNVRSGPGVGYRVVDTLYRGEQVDVEDCRNNGWCYIRHHGRDGWVSARYLRDVQTYRQKHRARSRSIPQQPTDPRYYRNDRNQFQFNFSFGNSNQPHLDNGCVRYKNRVICN